MILNITNHSSKYWSSKQKSAAERYGEIKDIPFPKIDPFATGEEVDAIVTEYLQRIMKYDNPVIMVQGEFVFTFRLVERLKKKGFKVIAACSERHVIETTDDKGKNLKQSVFEFVQFREY